MIALLVLLGVLLLAFYVYMTWHHRHWQKLGIPCDKPSFLFGSLRDSTLLRRNRGEEMDKIYAAFPGEKVVGWYNYRMPGLLIRDPEIVHRILVTDFNYFRNNDIESDKEADPITSRNIFVLKDEEWKRSRALITPAFTSGKIKAIYPQMVEVAKDFTEYLRKHPEELHIKDTMSRYTTEIIAKCAFGIEGNAFKQDKPEIHQVGKTIFQPSLKNSFTFLVMFFIPVLNKIFNFKLVSTEVIKFFDSILRDVIQHRQSSNIVRNDLVQYLIDLKNKTIEVEKGNIKSENITRVYTDEDILSGCVMFFIEAYETSALLLTHIFHELAINKDVQEKLRQEIDNELKKGEITFEQVHEMQYLDSVVQETNRISPVTHFLFKKCTEDYNMDLGQGKSLKVARDTSIVVPLYGIHTDPLYWEDPLQFKPERFSSKEEVQRAKTKALFLPFGDGPRMCIGVRISTTMIKVALIHILSQLEVLPTSKTPEKMSIDPLYFMTTHKGGIHLRFAERSR